MADESNTESVETTAPVELVQPKKRPGPGPKTVVSSAAVETPVADDVATAKGRKTNTKKLNDGAAAVQATAKVKAKTKNTAKSAGKTVAVKQSTSALDRDFDDIANLLQLEEENARLRKTLAEKLRAENAELRKRLGIA